MSKKRTTYTAAFKAKVVLATAPSIFHFTHTGYLQNLFFVARYWDKCVFNHVTAMGSGVELPDVQQVTRKTVIPTSYEEF